MEELLGTSELFIAFWAVRPCLDFLVSHGQIDQFGRDRLQDLLRYCNVKAAPRKPRRVFAKEALIGCQTREMFGGEYVEVKVDSVRVRAIDERKHNMITSD